MFSFVAFARNPGSVASIAITLDPCLGRRTVPDFDPLDTSTIARLADGAKSGKRDARQRKQHEYQDGEFCFHAVHHCQTIIVSSPSQQGIVKIMYDSSSVGCFRVISYLSITYQFVLALIGFISSDLELCRASWMCGPLSTSSRGWHRHSAGSYCWSNQSPYFPPDRSQSSSP